MIYTKFLALSGSATLFTELVGTWALDPLLRFLVYDLVLFSPLFARFGNLQPEHVLGQVAASVIIIFSA